MECERSKLKESVREAYLKLEKERPLRLEPDPHEEFLRRMNVYESCHVRTRLLWQVEEEEEAKRKKKEEEALEASMREACLKLEEERPLRLEPNPCEELLRRENIYCVSDQEVYMKLSHAKKVALDEKIIVFRKVMKEEEEKRAREEEEVLKVSVREAYLKLEEERPLRLESNIDRARNTRANIYKPSLREAWGMSQWELFVASRKTDLLRQVTREEELKKERAPHEKLEEGRRKEEETSVREAYLKLEEERPLELQPNRGDVRRQRMNVYRLSEREMGGNDHWKKYVAYRKTKTLRRVTLEEEANRGRVREEWEEEVSEEEECPHQPVYDKYLWESEPACERCVTIRMYADNRMVLKEARKSFQRDVRETIAESSVLLDRRDVRWKEEKKEAAREVRERKVREKKEEVARKRKEEEEAERKKEEVRVRRKAAYEAGRESREATKKVKEELSRVRRRAILDAAKEARAEAARNKKEETRVRQEAAKEAAKEARAETARNKKEETKRRQEAAKEARAESRGNIYPKIPEENVVHQLLKKMGWTGGGLGRSGNEGRVEPIMHGEVRRRRALGTC